jgi:hypothetical protein
MATEGNGLQVTGQRKSEETEATRFFRTSGKHASDFPSMSRGWSMHGAQRPRDRGSFISFAEEPGSPSKETMPCLQRGHGMEPVGPTISDEILHVEHRQSAHLTQSSCLHPKYEKNCLSITRNEWHTGHAINFTKDCKGDGERK